MNQFVDRLLGAARLDVQTYEDVEHDGEATGQAVGVVVLASIAAGIGTLDTGIGMLIFGALASLIGWILWAGVIYLIGTKMLPEAGTQADMGQVLRALAFAQAPGLLRVFGFIPLAGPVVFLIATIWMLITMVVAVRQSLDYESTGRAIVVVMLGFLAYVLVFAIIGMLFGGMAGGPTGQPGM